MKWILIALVLIIGIFVFFVYMGASPMERDLSQSTNQTAIDTLGSNYTQFDGMPEILAYWWIIPFFFIAVMIGYGVYKIYKR